MYSKDDNNKITVDEPSKKCKKGKEVYDMECYECDEWKICEDKREQDTSDNWEREREPIRDELNEYANEWLKNEIELLKVDIDNLFHFLDTIK